MDNTVHCASCDKEIPFLGFGPNQEPQADDIRFLCQDCYDDAITEARQTYRALFLCCGGEIALGKMTRRDTVPIDIGQLPSQ